MARRGKRKNVVEGKESTEVTPIKANDNTIKKAKKRNLPQNQETAINSSEPKIPKKRRKRNQPVVASTTEIQEELDPKTLIIESEPSIRAKKKQKRNEIKEVEKVKHVLNMQQECLNYLSLWKHNRSVWKFQKLKQVWIYNNIFDDAKIPEKFFLTAIDYFNNGKGNLKEKLMEQASKIIDEEGIKEDDDNNKTNEKEDADDKEDDGNDEDDDEKKDDSDDEDDNEKEDNEGKKDSKDGNKIKFQRARTIMQHMN